MSENTKPESQTLIKEVTRGELHDALKAASVTASGDETRPHLCGIYVETLEGTETQASTLRLVSTDGHRLTKIDIPLPSAVASDYSALWPLAGVEALIKMLKGRKADRWQHCTIKVSDHGVVTVANTIEGSTLNITPRNEAFPPYDRVIPPERTANDQGAGLIGLNARYLADVQKVATFYANDRSGGVMFQVAGDRDPVRIDMHNGEASTRATMVIMPMRV